MPQKPTYEELEKCVQELESIERNRKQEFHHLKASETYYQSILDASPILFAIHQNGVIRSINQAGAHLLGTDDPDDLSERSVFDFVHPDSRDLVEKRYDRLNKGLSNPSSDIRILKLNGDTAHIQATSIPFVYQGEPAVLLMAIDITRYKQIENDLRQSEQALQRTLDATTDGIWTWNFKTNQLSFSPKYYTMLGYAPDAFPADFENWRDLIHPEDRKKALAVAEEYLKTKPDLYDNEFRMKTRTGDYRWIMARARVVERNTDGEALYMIGNHEDITERKRAEQGLRDSHARFLTVLNSIDAAIYVADIDTGEIIFMNQRLIESFGRDMTGEICWKALRGESAPCGHCKNDRIIDKNGDPADVVVWNDKNPVTGRWYVNYDRAIEWVDGRVVRLQIATDITDFKAMEERVQQAQKMEAIGNLAGGIAHDFNNILFLIIGMAELLLEELPPESPGHESAAEILKAGKRGGDLVQQILAYSRQSEHKMIPVRVQQVLKEALKLSRSTIPAYIEITQNLQECGVVMANPTQLHQIAINLITNAYHAVEPKGGTIDIKLKAIELAQGHLPESILTPGLYAMLSVSDNGCGIDPELIDKIFDPYFTTKAQGKGTGLGLAVVYGIVKGHKGEIQVHSEVGKGTTFNIYLPLINAQLPDETDKDDKPAPHETGNEHLLIVDDEEQIIKLEKRIVEKLGYRVTLCNSSTDALAVFKADPDAYDLVITDMTMPNMTGDRFAEAVIAIKPYIPVIICTGFSERLNKEKAEAAGIKGFLMKPIVKSEMARTIRAVLDAGKETRIQS